MNDASWLPEPGHEETLVENWLFRLRRARFRSRSAGKTHDYFVMELADAVNIVALTPDRRVVLVRQFRAGSGRDSLETPGGLVDPHESPSDAAVRELREETGFVGKAPQVLGSVWSNPSILSSRTTFVLVTDARRVAETQFDPSEELSVELVPADAVPALIREGRIDHALAVLSLLYWLEAERGQSLGGPGSGPAAQGA